MQIRTGTTTAVNTITVEARLFNTLAKLGVGTGSFRFLNLPMGSTVKDAVARLQVPLNAIFMAWCNGQDITTALFLETAQPVELHDGDVIALSGYPGGMCTAFPFN